KAGYVVNPDPIEIADSLADYFSKGLEPEFSKFIAGEKKRFSWKNLIDAVVSVASKKSKK
ncbi:MAG TPA: hypothetical protein VLH61_11115, partial [Bacteroidales bacterium]|nr:hypothetical protein [Bacteroidales bacterium]